MMKDAPVHSTHVGCDAESGVSSIFALSVLFRISIAFMMMLNV